ncbi:hypothetical protein TNCT_708541 [Trichonephila clavata]|uniref:Uncharacterized protein n=1 Tax=Trichonephila clavata TaxID=2740835 RepID=A0A8X6KPA3_TRICU|nr:hypothetical protein TNCT_708541 [Trichonephila clavata]
MDNLPINLPISPTKLFRFFLILNHCKLNEGGIIKGKRDFLTKLLSLIRKQILVVKKVITGGFIPNQNTTLRKGNRFPNPDPSRFFLRWIKFVMWSS